MVEVSLSMKMILIGIMMIVMQTVIGKSSQRRNFTKRGGEKSPLHPGEKFKRLQCCNNY
jgi:hypothetical protein